jgi:hypothetical protein
MTSITKKTFKAFVALSFLVSDWGCTSACIRNTDCTDGYTCSAGACVIVIHVEGGSVSNLTPAPSETLPVGSAEPDPSAAPEAGSAEDAGDPLP